MVWWRCEKGHEWETLISTRAGGSKCSFCSGIKLLEGFNDLKKRNLPMLRNAHKHSSYGKRRGELHLLMMDPQIPAGAKLY